MTKRTTLFLAVFLIAAAAHAQLSLGGDSGLISDAELLKLSGVVTQRSGDDLRGTVTATIAKGWHINSVKPLDDFVIPSELKFDPATAELVRADFPPHELKDFTFSGGKKLAVYEGTIAIPFQAKLKNGATAIKATLRFQSCNDSVCLPPKTASTEISTNAVAPPPVASKSFTPLSAAPKNPLPNSKLAEVF